MSNNSRPLPHRAAQTLQNKVIDGGIADNQHAIILPQNTTTNLAALGRQEASIAYDTTLNSLVLDTGTGFAALGGLPSPLESLATYTSDFQGSPSTFLGNQSDADQTNQLIVVGSTDTAIAANNTTSVLLIAGDNTAASSTGNAGSAVISGGSIVNGSGNAGGVSIQGGNVTAGTGAGGGIQLIGGISTSVAGGNISLVVGTGTSSGKIILNDHSGTITAGKVWTATDTQGSGHWAAAGGASNPNVVPTRITTGAVTVDASTDYQIILNDTTGTTNIPINLPAGTTGLTFGFTKSSAAHTAATTYVLTPNGSDTIDFATSFNNAIRMVFISGIWYLMQ